MNGNSPHSQIDSLIMQNDAFAPIQKLNQMIQMFPLMDSTAVSEIMGLISEGGDTLDIGDYKNINKYATELSDLNFITSGNPEMMIQENMTGSMSDAASRLNQSIAKDPQIFDAAFKEQTKRIQGFKGGGMISPKYPAFDMPSNRTPGKSIPKKSSPPKVPPTENLGVGPAIAKTEHKRFRPKRKPPMGVPQPKPYNPFSQEMNQFG